MYAPDCGYRVYCSRHVPQWKQIRMSARQPSPGVIDRQSPWKSSLERTRERAIKREAVIRAAARAFRVRGYHRTSLDDLAADLNVTKPTIYRYVDNKEQMLYECFRTGLDGLRKALRQAHKLEAPALERLRTVLRDYTEAITSDFGWCMVRAEDQDLSPAMSRKIKALKSEIDQGIRRLIQEGIEDGSIRPCDPKMTAFALAGALNWISHWHRENDALTPAQIADLFFELFERGLSPRS